MHDLSGIGLIIFDRAGTRYMRGKKGASYIGNGLLLAFLGATYDQAQECKAGIRSSCFYESGKGNDEDYGNDY